MSESRVVVKFSSSRCLLFGLAVYFLANCSIAQSERPVDFSREIQPLFAKQCFACHGPDKNEGGLRLDTSAAALARLDSGLFAIVPGKAAASELLRRVTSSDESERMPPEGKPLSKSQIDTLRRWIAEGANFEQHWAYQPLTRPEVPQVKRTNWVRSPIDAFILHSLEARGLSPTAPAEKTALLRRATFDLTGLPPTWNEVQAFQADDSPQAFEKVVDRLLASKRYGEKWGRHWLDIVRYAETNSFERDGPKPHAWRYRDYVIRSFNDDKPYDQFIREQLAGDELETVTPESIIATGFYRLGLWDDEPADRALARYDELDDLVTTVSQGFLGLTVNCARCHDHKIDPIPQRDYYSLLAFFQNIKSMTTTGPNIEVPIFINGNTKEQFEAQTAALDAERGRVQGDINQMEAQFAERLEAESGDGTLGRADLDDLAFRFYRDTWDQLPDFNSLKPETTGKVPGHLFDLGLATRETAFGFVFEGTLIVPADGDYTLFLDSDDGSRLTLGGQEVIAYDGIHGVGRARQANLHLKQGRLPIKLEYFQKQFGWGLHLSWLGPGFKRRFLTTNVGSSDGKRPGRGGEKRNLQQLIQADGGKTLGQETFARYTALRKELETLKQKKVPADYALAITENGPTAPETFLLERGNPQTPGEKVEPAFVSILDSQPAKLPAVAANAQSSGRRRALADWIASKENRLTARVMANRLWQHHFGRGIVRSPNNFGGLGDPPTHPELLDWLASELMAGDWRLKRLHKQIMLSSTYQMSSRPSQQALKADPGNDLFSRFDMRRLTAEEVRDCLLATSGQLNLKMYGPSIYPEISAEVLAGQSQPGKGWHQSPPDEAARRSVYIHVKRSLVTPLLSAFDFPDTDFSCDARFSTTQPAQALSMMNGKFLGEQAAAFAQRLEKEAGADPAARLRRAFEIALCRQPTKEESARGLELIETLTTKHNQDSGTAWKFYCLTILNRNEFLYLD